MIQIEPSNKFAGQYRDRRQRLYNVDLKLPKSTNRRHKFNQFISRKQNLNLQNQQEKHIFFFNETKSIKFNDYPCIKSIKEPCGSFHHYDESYEWEGNLSMQLIIAPNREEEELNDCQTEYRE